MKKNKRINETAKDYNHRIENIERGKIDFNYEDNISLGITPNLEEIKKQLNEIEGQILNNKKKKRKRKVNIKLWI